MGSGLTPGKSYVIVGPTAVGKTAYAIKLAMEIGGEIVSADSMQIYEGLDIGTAKPSPEELKAVPHHMIGIANPREGFSVVRYREMAGAAIDDILRRGKVPVVAGGTGLYVNSLLFDMGFEGVGGGENPALRTKLTEDAAEFGNEYVHGMLAGMDPAAAGRIHPNNLKKVIRSIERLSAAQGKALAPFSAAMKPGKLMDAEVILLMRDRDELYGRIEIRVGRLMEAGLLEEVEGLAESGLGRDHISMLGIGYKELLDYLEGKYGLEEAVDLIKRNSRRYAKRQITWFKRYENARIVDLSGS